MCCVYVGLLKRVILSDHLYYFKLTQYNSSNGFANPSSFLIEMSTKQRDQFICTVVLVNFLVLFLCL